MSHAALIGDLVQSRTQPDRRATQQALGAALSEVNGMLDPVQPMTITVGDEFQGVFPTVAQAVMASVLVRLRLVSVIDTRYGIGWGDIDVFDHQQRPVPSQDGPAWWAARDAIVEIERQASQPRLRHLRTWFLAADEPERALERFVNAFLMNRDTLVGDLPERGRRLLFGLLVGTTQRALAEGEAISESAVSQYLARHGLLVLAESHRLLSGGEP